MDNRLILYAANIKDKEFKREAEKFRKFHKMPKSSLVPIDCRQPLWKRRKAVYEALLQREDLDVVAILCHGWPRRIQFGFNLDNVADLANAIRDASIERGCKVLLYCCSCGRRPGLDPKKRIYFPVDYVTYGSFASELSLELGTGREVFAHYDSGHTTKNPYALVFQGVYWPQWIVEPHHKDWAAWKKDLKGTGRFDFFL